MRPLAFQVPGLFELITSFIINPVPLLVFRKRELLKAEELLIIISFWHPVLLSVGVLDIMDVNFGCIALFLLPKLLLEMLSRCRLSNQWSLLLMPGSCLFDSRVLSTCIYWSDMHLVFPMTVLLTRLPNGGQILSQCLRRLTRVHPWYAALMQMPHWLIRLPSSISNIRLRRPTALEPCSKNSC